MSRSRGASPVSEPPASSRAEVVILVIGLAAAALSGIAAYRSAGLYGDAFLNYGFFPVADADPQASYVARRAVTDDGLLLHYVFDRRSRRLAELRVMPGGDAGVVKIDLAQGVPGRFDLDRNAIAWDTEERRVKIGYALRGRGRIDAWQYWGADGQLQEVRLSRRQAGVVDRWEYYHQGQLARVEEDSDRDGRVDRWQTYEAGILIDEAVDRDGDGRPDAPLSE